MLSAKCFFESVISGGLWLLYLKAMKKENEVRSIRQMNVKNTSIKSNLSNFPNNNSLIIGKNRNRITMTKTMGIITLSGTLRATEVYSLVGKSPAIIKFVLLPILTGNRNIL